MTFFRGTTTRASTEGKPVADTDSADALALPITPADGRGAKGGAEERALVAAAGGTPKIRPVHTFFANEATKPRKTL